MSGKPPSHHDPVAVVGAPSCSDQDAGERGYGTGPCTAWKASHPHWWVRVEPTGAAGRSPECSGLGDRGEQDREWEQRDSGPPVLRSGAVSERADQHNSLALNQRTRSVYLGAGGIPVLESRYAAHPPVPERTLPAPRLHPVGKKAVSHVLTGTLPRISECVRRVTARPKRTVMLVGTAAEPC